MGAHMSSEQQLTDGRLKRIEDKIDKLSDAMISLAKAEEKLASIEATNRVHYDRMNRHSEKIDEISARVDDNSRTIKIIHVLSYLFAAGLMSALFKIFLA